MSMHRIAVISDTHGILRPEAAAVLQSAELILHGGDITDQRTLDGLREFARVIAVRGNCDRDLAENLPQEICVELYGRKIYMIHNKKQMSAKAEEADIVIYGHSHRYVEKEEDGRLWLNPGSAGAERFGRPATMAVLEIDEKSGSLTVKKTALSGDGAGALSGKGTGNLPGKGAGKLSGDGAGNLSGKGAGNLPVKGAGNLSGTAGTAAAGGLCPEYSSGDLWEIIETVVRDLERGRSVDRIVKTRRVSRALAEQIGQIYFTHPGITVQGVMDRMEIAGR